MPTLARPWRHRTRPARALRARLAAAEQALDSCQRELAALQHQLEARPSGDMQPLRAILDQLAVGVFQIDAEGRYHYVNRRAAEPIGLTPDAVIGKSILDILPPAAAQAELDRYRRIIATGRTTEYEVTFETPQGPWTYAMVGQVLNDPQSGPSLLVSGVDITAYKQAAAALQVALSKYQTLFDCFPLGIAVTDAQGRIIEANRMAELLAGLSQAEQCQRAIDDAEWQIVRPDGSPMPAEEYAGVRAIREQRRVENVEMGVLTPRGETTWIAVTAAPLPLGGGGIVITCSDITARRQAEAALRLSEEHYRGLIESLGSIVFTLDANGTLQYVNQLAAQRLGGTPQDLVGQRIDALLPAAMLSAHIGALRQVFDGGAVVVHEDLVPVQGQLRWHRISFHPIHDAQGQVLVALVNATDIHDLKATQEELRALNLTLEARVAQRTAELQDLYDRAPTGYYALDDAGQICNANQTLLDWLGYTRAEVLGRPFTDLMSPADQAIFAAGFPAFKARGWLRDQEGVLLRKDGSTLAVLLNATAVCDANGRYTSSRATVVDNTERRKAEDALRLSEARLHLLLDKTPAVIFSALAEPDFRTTFISESVRQVLGYAPAEFLGRPDFWAGRIHPEDKPRLFGDTARLFAQGWCQYEYRCRHADGSDRWVETGVSLLPATASHPAEVVGYMIDISSRKQAETLLQHANAELARAAQAKDEFLATMSHELRSPLNAILGFSESLQDGLYEPLTAVQQGAIQHIETSGRHLLALINDILDLAKGEAGRLTLEAERLDVVSICQASLLFVKELAIKKGLRLDVRFADPHAVIEADPRRLKQMLVNLLSNAVKFTPSGGQIVLEAAVDMEADLARFSVEDSGIGIAPEHLGRLFQPFSQIDSTLTRRQAGSGLGLALVRRLAALHGGEVSVVSSLGVGSRFTITLPARQPGLATSEPAPEAPGELAETANTVAPAGVRVLVADDNEENLELIVRYLQAKGYAVVAARSGQEALDQVGAARPAVILMDIQMPNLDGLEVIRRLRAMPAYAATPILALTALAMPGDRERCLAAGATAYLAKPTHFSTLLATIRRLLG